MPIALGGDWPRDLVVLLGTRFRRFAGEAHSADATVAVKPDTHTVTKQDYGYALQAQAARKSPQASPL